MIRTITGRARATLATISAVAVLAPASAVSAAPTTTSEPTPAGAGWLANQFVDGERLQTAFGGDVFDDAGLTADAVLALSGAGVASGQIEAGATWLAENVATYAGDGETESYAGATAKLILVAEATGADATAFGGTDLVARLTERLTQAGRYSDLSSFGDFSNVITQSLAISALDRTASVSVPAVAVDYLVGQQCDDGGFPLELEAETCESSVDATAFASQALLAAGRTTVAAQTADYLRTTQKSDGSWGDGETGNANSTGLATAAMSQFPFPNFVTSGRNWLTGIQETCDDAAPGAFPFSTEDRGDVQRATAQALLGMATVTFADVDGTTASEDVPTFDCPKRYSDVAYGQNVHVPAINELTRREIVQGKADGTFGPKESLTRGQIATLIGKAGAFEPVEEDQFSDLAGNPHRTFINALAKAGIVTGFEDGTYRPTGTLTRDQSATMFAKWLELEPVEEDQFDDIQGNVHRTLINALAVEGVAKGTSQTTFSPKRALPRDQSATFALRAIEFLEAQGGGGPL